MIAITADKKFRAAHFGNLFDKPYARWGLGFGNKGEINLKQTAPKKLWINDLFASYSNQN
jgi:hypothetical protein